MPAHELASTTRSPGRLDTRRLARKRTLRRWLGHAAQRTDPRRCWSAGHDAPEHEQRVLLPGCQCTDPGAHGTHRHAPGCREGPPAAAGPCVLHLPGQLWLQALAAVPCARRLQVTISQGGTRGLQAPLPWHARHAPATAQDSAAHGVRRPGTSPCTIRCACHVGSCALSLMGLLGPRVRYLMPSSQSGDVLPGARALHGAQRQRARDGHPRVHEQQGGAPALRCCPVVRHSSCRWLPLQVLFKEVRHLPKARQPQPVLVHVNYHVCLWHVLCCRVAPPPGCSVTVAASAAGQGGKGARHLQVRCMRGLPACTCPTCK